MYYLLKCIKWKLKAIPIIFIWIMVMFYIPNIYIALSPFSEANKNIKLWVIVLCIPY